MVSRKHILPCLILAGLMAFNSQAGLWSKLNVFKMPNIIVKKVTNYVRNNRVAKIVKNNHKIAIATSIALIATPAAIWLGRRLLSQIKAITPGRMRHRNNNISNHQSDRQKDNKKIDDKTSNNVSITPKNKNNEQKNKTPETTSDSNQKDNKNSPRLEQALFKNLSDPFCYQRNNHPFFKTGLVEIKNNNSFSDYNVKKLQDIAPSNINEKTERVNLYDKKNQSSNLQGSVLTDSWAAISHPEYECRLLTPKSIDKPSGKIILVCPQPETIKEKNDKEVKKFKGECLKFGRYLALAYKKQIDIIFFDWNDENNQATTIGMAANQLSQLINKREGENKDTAIWTIAHGRSCNVINKLATQPLFENRKIDVAIHIGSPLNDTIKQKIFNKIYNFYSTADIDQATATWLSLRKYDLNCADKCYNVRIQHHGTGLTSANKLRKTLDAMNIVALLFDIDVHYNTFNDLDANCYTNREFGFTYPQVTIRNIDSIKAQSIAEYIRKYHNHRNNNFKDQYHRDMREKEPAAQKIYALTLQSAQNTVQNPLVQNGINTLWQQTTKIIKRSL